MIEFSRIIVVEPHADDAFLSLGAHIERWKKHGKQVTIVTVFSATRRRARDAESYARAVGADFLPLGFAEGQTFLKVPFPLPSGGMVLPLALTHPEHASVRRQLETPDSLFYVDQPYATVQKNSDPLTRLLRGMEVVSYLKPGIRKYRHIPLFRDQSKFFHFNPAEKLRETFEMIVRKYKCE